MTKSRKRTWLGLFALCSTVLAAGAFTACGEGGEGGDQGGETITIGVLEPLSGGFSGPGEAAVAAVNVAAEQINDAGGVLGGRQLEVVAVDSTTDDANKASAAATQLLESNPAFVVGPFVSAVALPASTVFERAHVPQCVASFSDELTSRGYKYLFELPPTASEIAASAVDSFTKVVGTVAPGAKQIAAVRDSNPGQAVVDSFAKELAQETDFEVVLNLQFPVGLTNAGPIAQKIKSSGADVLVPGVTVSELEQILGSLSALGVGEIPIFNPGGGSPSTTEYVGALGKLVNGQFVLPTWDYDMQLSPEQNKLLEQANADFTEANPDQPFMGQFAGEDYTCTNVMVAAMEKAESADPEAIREAVAGATFTSEKASLMPPGEVHFNENGLNDAAIPLVSQWCNGKMHTIAPEDLAATEPKSAQACGRP